MGDSVEVEHAPTRHKERRLDEKYPVELLGGLNVELLHVGLSAPELGDLVVEFGLSLLFLVGQPPHALLGTLVDPREQLLRTFRSAEQWRHQLAWRLCVGFRGYHGGVHGRLGFVVDLLLVVLDALEVVLAGFLEAVHAKLNELLLLLLGGIHVDVLRVAHAAG